MSKRRSNLRKGEISVTAATYERLAQHSRATKTPIAQIVTALIESGIPTTKESK